MGQVLPAIERLERLLERIENGRVMRLLRWSGRRTRRSI
jgi:hypothetical protein